MGNCKSTEAGSEVDPCLLNSKSHLYQKHLNEAVKVEAKAKAAGIGVKDKAIAVSAGNTYATSADPLELFSYNGALMTANGSRFYLKGINWFGMETNSKCPQGLWAQPCSFLLDFLVANGFNAVRIPLCAQFCLNLDDTSSLPSGFDTAKNSALVGKTYGGVLDYVFQQGAARGIYILLDMHVLTVAGGIGDPLWYNSTISEAKFIQAWQNLANRYKTQWNLLGCDLKNEIHGAGAWASTNASVNWDQAAVRTGNAVLAIAPKVLIFVEGTCGNNFPVEKSANQGGYWWGGDLSSAAAAPISLSVPNKLVYSPHCYGPDVYVQPYFKTADFPKNMPAIWNSHFGHILANKPLLGPALCIGEWGGSGLDVPGKPDATWNSAFVPYIQQLGATDTFFWALNPTSVDTGGILNADWATPVQLKLNLLATLQPSPAKVTLTNGIPSSIFPGGSQTAYSLTPGTTLPPTTSTTTTPPVSLPPTTTTTTPPPATTPPIVTPPVVSDSTYTLTANPVSTWNSDGKLLCQLNYTLTVNGGANKVTPTLGLQDVTRLQQVWNVTQTSQVSNGYTVFTLPTWIVQAGGMAPGANTSFGLIYDVTAGSPVWAINP